MLLPFLYLAFSEAGFFLWTVQVISLHLQDYNCEFHLEVSVVYWIVIANSFTISFLYFPPHIALANITINFCASTCGNHLQKSIFSFKI